MVLTDNVIVVTGGGNGIGRALCRRFAAEGAKAVVVADVNGDLARQVAAEIRGTAIEANVSREADVARLVAQTIAQHGRIDLFLTPTLPNTSAAKPTTTIAGFAGCAGFART